MWLAWLVSWFGLVIELVLYLSHGFRHWSVLASLKLRIGGPQKHPMNKAFQIQQFLSDVRSPADGLAPQQTRPRVEGFQAQSKATPHRRPNGLHNRPLVQKHSKKHRNLKILHDFMESLNCQTCLCRIDFFNTVGLGQKLNNYYTLPLLRSRKHIRHPCLWVGTFWDRKAP